MTQNHVVALVTQLFGPPCKIVGDTSYHLDEAVSVNSKTSQIKVGVEPPMTIDELVDELEKEIEQKNGQNNHTTITQYVKDRTDPHRYRVAPGLEDLPLGDLGAGISDPDPPPPATARSDPATEAPESEPATAAPASEQTHPPTTDRPDPAAEETKAATDLAPAAQPNNTSAPATKYVSFLEKLRPGRPWLLIEIVPDNKPTAITASTAEQVEAFVRKHDGKANLYYSVNPTRHAMSKKAAKTDIAAIEYLLGDLDPNEGETSEAAKARYLKAIDSFEPKPTAAIDSGNGIQGLWRLQERIVLGEPIATKNEKGKTELVFSPEDQAKIDDAEARTAAIMVRLGAKVGTQNIDRILRLPDTTNLPNAKKRKEGRTKCPTKLLWFNDASYPLDAFPSAAPTPTPFERIETEISKASGFEVAPGLEDLPLGNLAEGLGKPRDETASGYGFRFMRDCHVKGMSYEQARAAILADKTTAGEWARRDDVDERQLKRAWENSENFAQSQRKGITQPLTAKAVFRDLYESGKPKPSLANAVIAIRALGIVVRYDLFHHRIIVTYKGQSKTIHEGLLTDNTTSAIRSLINNTYQVDCGDSCTLAAIKEIAWTNAYDPVLDMLDECQLKWDGVKRLDTWTTVYLGCENTPLHSAIGRLTLIAACRRARVPGCKFDQIVVQEGPEGKNKSTSIRVLAGDENFSDQSILGASDKEVQEQLDGIWMHENADLAGMRKAEVERVKTFARRQVDRARPAYGHVREDRPRRSIEWGTTSEDTYMVSQTGNRCFWPLKTGKIDVDALKRDRDQLIGEAATCEAVNETIVLNEKLWPNARAAQEQRRITDPWEDLLADIPDVVDITMDETTRTITIVHRSNDGSERVASADLLTYVLNVPKAQQSPLHSQRLAHAMKHLGWTRNPSGRVTINDVPVRGYIRNTPENIPWDP